MPWIPGVYERRYYNPQRFNLATAILETHERYARAEALTDQVPGLTSYRSDDIPSAWLTLRPPAHAIPKIGTGSIVTPPEKNLIVAKELAKVRAEQAAAKAAEAKTNGGK